MGWLVERNGRESIAALIGRVADGESFGPAFRAVFGSSRTSLEAEWKRGFLRRYRWMPILTSGSTPWFVMMILAVVGWARKKHRTAARLLEMEEEERMGKALGGTVRETPQ